MVVNVVPRLHCSQHNTPGSVDDVDFDMKRTSEI